MEVNDVHSIVRVLYIYIFTQMFWQRSLEVKWYELVWPGNKHTCVNDVLRLISPMFFRQHHFVYDLCIVFQYEVRELQLNGKYF